MKKLSVLLSLILLLSACSNTATQTEDNTVLIAVESQKVQKDSIQSTIVSSSKVEANQELSVIPKMAGIVTKSYFNLGDFVQKGDTLFTIDSSDIQVQVNQAKSGLGVAQANYDLTVNGTIANQIQQLEANVQNLKIQYNDLLKKLNDTKELYEAGAVAKQEVDNLSNNVDLLKLQLDTAENNLKLTRDTISQGTKNVSQATVQQAQSGVQSATHLLLNTVVTAQLSGVISVDNVVDGQMVSMQSPAFVISDMDSVKIKFQVSQDVINEIKVGTPVNVTISSISDKPIASTISNVSFVADKMTSLYPVEVTLQNPNHTIKPGMFATVSIIMSEKKGIIALPIDTVIQKDDESFVYTIGDDDVVHKQVVTTGIQNEDKIEIKTGLTEGMNVVVKGQQFINDNTKVNVVNKEAKPQNK